MSGTYAGSDSLRQEILEELTGNIVPFWKTRVEDTIHGGFVGAISSSGEVIPDADKGLILNARNLWSYSACGCFLKDQTLLPLADRAYDYLDRHFIDRDHGGAFWMLDHRGNPVDCSKKSYGQAFLIYGWVEYFRFSGRREALDNALGLYGLMEEKILDRGFGGYPEAFDRDWSENDALRLSDKDMNEKKSMNNHLHVLEAYTQLYIETCDSRVKDSILALLEVFWKHIIDHPRSHLRLFFSSDWICRSEQDSYGHDIEAAWLLCEAAEAIGNLFWKARLDALALKMADACLREGVDSDGALYHEGWKGHIHDGDKHWWPQAEAVVGFINAWQISGEARYLEAASKTWGFIRSHLVDGEHGEWHWKVDRQRNRCPEEPKVSAWKSFYHNSRFCIESVSRLGKGVHGMA